MTRTRLFVCCLLAALAFAAPLRAADDEKVEPIAVAELKRTDPVDFEKEILPIFKSNCLACHNQAEARGDLVLESPATIAKGSESGDAVTPGKGAASLLIQTATRQAKPYMPPPKNKVGAKPLTPQELALIQLWIDQGASGEVKGLLDMPVDWQPLPPGLNPIYAVSLSSDEQYAAASRANQVFIYHLPTKRFITRLTDPELILDGFADKPGIAHRDLVQAVEFSPNGELLATGGYRIVKLWQRPRNAQKEKWNLGAEAKAVAVSPDGKWLAAAVGNAIKLYETEDGKHVRDLTGHTAEVRDLKFSHDSTRLLSGAADKMVRVWNVADGKELGKIETAAEVNAVTWLKQGELLATGGQDNAIRIWNTKDATDPPKPEPKAEEKKEGEGEKEEGDKKEGDAKPAEPQVKPVHEIKQHGGPITSLATLPSADTQFISGSEDSTVRHWNGDNGQQVRQMNHGGKVTAVAVRPDGQRFASVADNGTAKLWNAGNGQQVAELKQTRSDRLKIEAAQRYTALAGEHVNYFKGRVDEMEKRQKAEEEAVKKADEALKTADKEMKEKQEAFAKAKENKEKAETALTEATAAVKKATEEKAAAEKAQETARAAQKTAGEEQNKANQALSSAQNTKNDAERKHNEANQQVEQAKQKLEQAKKAASEKPDDKGLADAAAAAEKELKEKEAAAAEAKKAFDSAVAELEKATKVKEAADKAKTDADKAVTDADNARREADKTLNDANNKQRQAEQNVKNQEKPFNDAKAAHEQAVRNLMNAMNAMNAAKAALERATESVASVKKEHEAAEAEQTKAKAEQDAVSKQVNEPPKPLRAVAFTADNTTLFTAGDDNIVRSWSAEEGDSLESFAGHGGVVHTLVATPDGNVLSASADQHAVVWYLDAPWKLVDTLGTGDTESPIEDRVISLAFSPDGKMLATGGGFPSRSGEVKLWNVEDASLIREITDAHSDTVFGMQFSFDGAFLATCAADKFVKQWNVATGEHVRSYEGHTHHVLDVSWSADGRTLVSAGADNVVKMWDVVNGGQKRTISGYGKEVTSAKFIGVSNEVITSAGDKQVRRVRENGQNVRGYGGGNDFMHAADVSPDGKIVIAGGQDSILRIWNGDNGQSIATFEPPKEAEQTVSK